jgi:uncharacterized membrane-anchored protein
MSDSIRVPVMFIAATLVVAFVNLEIAGKLAIIRGGETVLLQLAPRDPRSLIQGDYMALRYAMASQVASAAESAGLTDGTAVIEMDADHKARFVAIYNAQQTRLTDRQRLLRFRKRGDSVRLASDAFFFEEGQWDLYSGARYGELRVNAEGDAVLTGLRDGNAERLGDPMHPVD